MTVYIEYAFLQNFFLDGVLLWLTSKATKTPITRWKLLVSSLFGGIFAVVYPLLRLPTILGLLLKISAGCFLCLLVFGRLQGKKEWGRYALFTSLFFLLSFLYGGALSSITQGNTIKHVKTLVTPLGFLLLTVFCTCAFKKLYIRSTILRKVYTCEMISGEKRIKAQGFYDSGNVATKGGIPVCFLSPEIGYELWGEKLLFAMEERGQVCDEMCITTMAGTKKVPLYKGALRIETKEGVREINEVFFALSANIVSREYKLILHSRIFEIGEGI